MREITVKLEPNIITKFNMSKIISKIEKIELQELLRLDIEKGIKVAIVNITTNKGYKLEDLEFSKYVTLLNVLNQKDNSYTVLIKSEAPKYLIAFSNQFLDVDLIWGKPCGFFNNELIYTCMGSEKDLNKFVKAIKFIGKIKNISYNEGLYKKREKSYSLTDKQKEIFSLAKKRGYYEYPRKISATELSLELNVSKATLIEHLRKIENKILSEINI